MPLKEKLFAILRSPDFEQQMEAWDECPPSKIVSGLLAALYSGDEEIKWHAVTALGILTARVAQTDLESARNTLRRLIWSLNEGSGGIGWGSPEAIGEILARQPSLAREYAAILVSYIRPGENFLEFRPLQRGALWAVGRLAGADSALVASLGAGGLLHGYLHSPDPLVKGHALWAGARVGFEGNPAGVEALLGEESEIRIYEDRKFRSVTIGELAREALEGVRESRPERDDIGPADPIPGNT
jgi:hypothetical protein